MNRDAGPYSIVAGTDGNLWFTQNNANSIARLTPDGCLSEFVIPSIDCGASIIAAVDNGAWFTEYNADKIAFIDFKGSITEYCLAGKFSPYGITVDNEEAIWFTCMASNQIGRKTSKGITYFNLPTPKSYPSFIAFGHDGGLWFTQNQGNRIGRISKEGVVTEFSLPNPDSAPVGIVAGKEALWFTEIEGNRIGRIAYDGSLAEFELPTASAKPHAITVSDEGLVAFSEWGVGKIGFITKGGLLLEQEIPATASEPHGLVFDRHGELWVAFESGAIGRLKPEIPSVLPHETEVLDAGPFYHGTKADLELGDLLVPGLDSNYGKHKKSSYIFMSATLDAAIWGGELAQGNASGRIYRVEPTGEFEDDPNLTDKKFPGNQTRSYRTKKALRVAGEVLDWEGHTTEALQNMLNHLETLKDLGIEAIND